MNEIYQLNEGELICPKCGKHLNINYTKRINKWIFSLDKREWVDSIHEEKREKIKEEYSEKKVL